ncbi:MAG: acetyl-CoA carboxylase biotin carboxylase subunit [Cyanobacteriota bacterium]
MFKKVLIANRGEIALRIIRACVELGIETVAVYSEADETSLHVQLADEAYCIGPPHPTKSYLDTTNLMSIILNAGVDAVHPGYGFLAENANFSEMCSDHNVEFIGSSPDNIKMMGDKSTARSTMDNIGVPIVPGTALVDNIESIRSWADEVGYPVLIKATAGGGGKGMRIVESGDKLIEQAQMAKAEASACFGNDGIYVEKYLLKPRHIEIQIIADKYGNVIYLPERDCSIQRRHQKLLEESPSPAISPETRRKMGEYAALAAKSINYIGVGTIEYLYDIDGKFYFMEMNTRIQVEHPVTEMVCGIDLVKEQIKVAAGQKLLYTQEEVDSRFRGHAIECRVNAEDPDKNFAPCPGIIEGYIAPGGIGVRVDSHVYHGYTIPPFYDSLVSKLITYGSDREEARQRMLRALDEYAITGIKTTIPFHQKILVHDAFVKGDVYTDFIATHMSPMVTNSK